MSEKLTKKFFLSLPTGLFLVSNVMEAPGQPMFAHQVKPPEQRADQWKQIVSVRANGRLCRVFVSPKDYMDVIMTVPYARERN